MEMISEMEELSGDAGDGEVKIYGGVRDYNRFVKDSQGNSISEESRYRGTRS